MIQDNRLFSTFEIRLHVFKIMTKTDYSDEYLVEGLKKKSHKIFEIIFNHYYNRLYRLAFAYLMNRDLAEDTIQEVFVSLWDTADTLSEMVHLQNYLYTSVKNACLDHFKHLQVIDVNKDKLTEALVFSGTAEYEEDTSLQERVKQLLSELPEQQRRVVEMKFFDGMSYNKIAEILNISEETVHTHIKRAYKFLRNSLIIAYLWGRFLEQLRF